MALLIGAYTLWWGGSHVRRLTIEQRINRYRDIIWKHSQAQALPVELVRAVIRAESGGDPGAHSNKDARGLMQVTPLTEKEVARHVQLPRGDLYDPDYNVLVGTIYLRQMLARFHGDLYLTLAAYHLGPTRVDDLVAVAPPGLTGRDIIDQYAPVVTRNYCRAVLGTRGAVLPVAPPSGQVAPPAGTEQSSEGTHDGSGF